MQPINSNFDRLLINYAKELEIPVTAEQAAKLACHARELLVWNRKVNLTAITDPSDMAIKHFVDSIAPMDLVPPGARLLDIGSGGGFPAIPLKIMIPTLSVTMIDASRKKVSFLMHLIRKLQLSDTEALHVRAEDFSRQEGRRGKFDIIVSRALSDLATFARLSIELLAPAGFLLAYKADLLKEHAEEMDALEKFLQSLPTGHAITKRIYRLPGVNAIRSVVAVRPEPRDCPGRR